ncbi:MAG: hypothetical protein AAF078_11315, partial [Planctomycetota bacterium]
MTEESIAALMERASGALVARDYAGCERLCLEGLRRAEAAGEWATYAAIVLPLQEARRQRRIIATEAGVAFVSDAGSLEVSEGWWVVTSPLGVDAVAAHEGALHGGGVMGACLAIERRGDGWVATGRSAEGRAVSAEVGEVDAGWLGRVVRPGD